MKNLILIVVLCVHFNSYCQTETKKPLGILTTVSTFMYASNGCNTIWVGVFSTTDGQSLLVASGEVHIGPGCPKRTSNQNSICEDGYIKDDYIVNSDSKDFKHCLIDCLKDEELYKKFESDKNRILENLNK